MKSLRALSIFAVSSAAVFASAVDVNINGHAVDFSDAQPFERNGFLMVPVTPILDQMGIDYEWNTNTKKLIASEVDTDVTIQVGSKTLDANGKNMSMDAAAIWRNGRVYVPIRFFGEALGAEVDWKKGSQTAEITGRLDVSTGAPAIARANITPALALDSELKTWYEAGDTLKFSLQANPGTSPVLYMDGGKTPIAMTEEKPGFYVASYTMPMAQSSNAVFSTEGPYASVSYGEKDLMVSFSRAFSGEAPNVVSAQPSNPTAKL